MMIMLMIIISITHQTVIYEFNANSNNIDGWLNWGNFGIFDTCGGIRYFGFAQNFYEISRIFFDLEPHSHLILDAQFLKQLLSNYKSIDNNNYEPKIKIDFMAQSFGSVKLSQGSICGNSSLEYLHTISITIQHNRRTGWIYIYQFKGGLISLKISIIQFQYECDGCNDNYHAIYQKWKLHQYSFHQLNITYSDGWTYQSLFSNIFECGYCQFLKFYSIRYQTQLPPHKDVLIRFQKADLNVIIVDYRQGTQTISSAYSIEILIKNHHEPLLYLNINSHSQTSTIRDFEVFFTQPEVMFKSLKEGCLEQIADKCLLCQEGWVQDEFLENCLPICGDGVIQGEEQCDSLVLNRSCYQCKHSCIQYCSICQFGICLQCLDGFVINANFSCDPLCGDGNLTPYSVEQCELTVNGVWDGCYDCKFISIANCKASYFSICLECEVGFQMLENACYPYCGDKLVLEQYEDCDDGNIQSYDGCYQCKFQCIEDCNICDRGQCILKCGDGYEFVNNNCHSICGDQIITKEEDCDDGNTLKFDGCFQCKYSCPENCFDCYQGTCLECNDQYKLLISNECKLDLKCGDGLLYEQEECDDGNYDAADGCNDCLIEQNWICITITKDSPSQCTFVQAPNLEINYLNMTQNKQYIHLQFNQQVQIYTPQLLSETIYFELLDVDKKHWNSSLFIIQDVGLYLSFGEYVIQIEVNQLLDFRPKLKIRINQTVANIVDVILDDSEKYIKLEYPKYLDETQKQYSLSLKSANQYLIYSLTGITAVSLLLGRGDLFVEILAILQFQQYLRYLNLQFPENLEIYFSINDLITIQPLLDFMQFPQFFQIIDIQSNQEYSNGKFKVYKQSTNLLINLSCQILQCVAFLFLILLIKWIKRVLYTWIFCSRFFYYMSVLSLYINPKFIFKFSQSYYNICLNLLKLEKFMSLKGLQKALLLNGWDMIFKTLLSTQNIKVKNYLDIVQLVITNIILILYFSILLKIFKFNQKQSKKGTRYERFQILNFARQFFFIQFLIYGQNSQILQLGLLLLTSLFQIIIVFNYRSVLNQKNCIVQIVVELTVFTFMCSSFLYIKEFDEYFNQNNKIMLGWFQAILLSQGIIIELIMIFQGVLQKLKQKCREKSP